MCFGLCVVFVVWECLVVVVGGVFCLGGWVDFVDFILGYFC